MWSRFLRESNFRDIAEVGVWKGEFAKHLLSECPDIRSYLMIDSWRHLQGWNKPFNLTDAEFTGIYQQALLNTDFARGQVRVLRGTTLEVRRDVKDDSLDFVYLDGDHSLRGIVIDSLSMWPKLRLGGVLAGDDFTDTVWQHSREFEPSLVNPFMRYFADAVGEELHILPKGQFFIRKSHSALLGQAPPASANYGLLALLQARSEQSRVAAPQSVAGKFVSLSKAAAKVVVRKLSSRYREHEALGRHGEKFPEYFRKTGVVFIHVPKAAGTSINLALYGRGGDHISLAEYWRKFPYSMGKMKTCAVLRDPLDRFASAFCFLKAGGINEVDSRFAEAHLASFHTPSQLAEALISAQLQYHVLNFIHFRTQVSWLLDTSGGRSVDCLVPLGRLQLLQWWLKKNLGRNLSFPISNVGPRGAKKSEEFSVHAKEVLFRIYAEDFEIHKMLLKDPACLCSSAAKTKRLLKSISLVAT
jgi:hypothetical protein